jgi:rare lipoprotein A
MKRSTTLLLPAVMIVGLAVAQDQKLSGGSSVHHEKKNTKIQYGTASYYANKFDGRKTANGEVFNQKKMTAACNMISLNTWVKVTNLHNKKTTIVKITDRMHPKNKRLIDLSRSAALKLGYTNSGLAKVKVEVLGKKEPPGWRAEWSQP